MILKIVTLGLFIKNAYVEVTNMKMKKRTIALILVSVLCISCLTGCNDASARRDKQYSEEMKSQIAEAIGYPDLANFFEYAQLKEIYEKALKEVGETHAQIFDIHMMMLDDDDYNESIENIIDQHYFP